MPQQQMTSAVTSPTFGREAATGSAPALKGFHDGTHRTVAPRETLERARPHLDRMGITRVANITGLDTLGIPVVAVCRPNSRSLAVSQGKGLDLDAARASGVMESIESYHAEHVALPLRLGSYRELREAGPVVDVASLPRLSVSTFHDGARLLWIQGVDLLRGERSWLPYEIVHTDYTLPLPPGSGSFMMSSNGLSSGNHFLEAVSHGICEIVERDATTLWTLSGEQVKRSTRLDLGTVGDLSCRLVLERFERAGALPVVWETTTDVGIPSFLCALLERSPAPLRPLPVSSGMGCHPAREVALLRALTEAAQTRLTLISGSRDDAGRSTYQKTLDVDAARSLRTWAMTTEPGRRFPDVPTSAGATLDDDVAWELDRLRGAGFSEVVAVDLTKAEIGIPVVRIVIPGLESMHDVPGFVPGQRARARMEAEP
jgi:YcaO-like protein with predicted kinase domain